MYCDYEGLSCIVIMSSLSCIVIMGDCCVL